MSDFHSMIAMLLSSNIPPDQKDLSAETVTSVVITGIAVVFIGLIILIVLVTLYGKVFEAINKSAEEKKKAEAEAAARAKEKEKPEVKAVSAPAPAPAVEDGIEEEVVAAIMGALSAMYAGSGKKPVLKGVKAAKPRRSAWSAAGIMDNTRPF